MKTRTAVAAETASGKILGSTWFDSILRRHGFEQGEDCNATLARDLGAHFWLSFDEL